MNKPNRPKHFNVEGRHGCGRREAESTSPAPKTWSGWVSSPNGSLVRTLAHVSRVMTPHSPRLCSSWGIQTLSQDTCSQVTWAPSVQSSPLIASNLWLTTSHGVPSPEYDMDACMASFLGGEAWEMCWVLGRPKSYTQLSCKYFRLH